MSIPSTEATFTRRNTILYDRFAHLIDGALEYSDNTDITELEENRMIQMFHTGLQTEAARVDKTYQEALDMLNEGAGSTATGGGVTAMHSISDPPNAAFMIRYKLAMIGQIYPNMISRHIVSSQPIPQPTYKIFYTDFIRDDDTSFSKNIHNRRDYSDNKEWDPSDPQTIARMRFSIRSESVEAETKKILTESTIESIQDLKAYHDMDVMNLLVSQMAVQIVQEWDRVIIDDLYKGATGGEAYWNPTAPTGTPFSEQKDYLETIFDALVDVDTQIFEKRFRKTNYLIVPASISAVFERIQGFAPETNGGIERQSIFSGGRYYAGMYKGRWKVFVDPFIKDKILMGYNSNAFWNETSYVFSPYEMAYISPVIHNAERTTVTRAIMSRAAKKVVISDLLGIVNLTQS